MVERFEALGFTMLVDTPHRLPTLNTVKIPDGVDEKTIRGRLPTEYRIEIGGGLGAPAGKVRRVGPYGPRRFGGPPRRRVEGDPVVDDDLTIRALAFTIHRRQ